MADALVDVASRLLLPSLQLRLWLSLPCAAGTYLAAAAASALGIAVCGFLALALSLDFSVFTVPAAVA